jgi:hypothetical protein
MSILSVLHDVKQQSGAIGLNGWQNVSDNIAPDDRVDERSTNGRKRVAESTVYIAKYADFDHMLKVNQLN